MMLCNHSEDYDAMSDLDGLPDFSLLSNTMATPSISMTEIHPLMATDNGQNQEQV